MSELSSLESIDVEDRADFSSLVGAWIHSVEDSDKVSLIKLVEGWNDGDTDLLIKELELQVDNKSDYNCILPIINKESILVGIVTLDSPVLPTYLKPLLVGLSLMKAR